MPLPIGTTVYSKRALPSAPEELAERIGSELSIIERALKDTAVRGSRTVTAATTVTLDDYLVCGDATGAAFDVTLPSVRKAAGRTFKVKRLNAGNTVTVTAAGTDTIDGSATYPLSAQFEAVTVVSDGTDWWVV